MGMMKVGEKIPVDRYGPLNMRDPTERVEIAHTVYKLMIHCAEKVIRDEKKRKRKSGGVRG